MFQYLFFQVLALTICTGVARTHIKGKLAMTFFDCIPFQNGAALRAAPYGMGK